MRSSRRAVVVPRSPRHSARWAGAALTATAAVLLSACGDEGGSTAAPTTVPSSTVAAPTTTASTAPPPTVTTVAPPVVGSETDCRDHPGVSSRADFDPQEGQYAVYLRGVDAGQRTVTFDVIQFLSGDDAARAYHLDHPDDPYGPPNDYYIVNAITRTDEATLTGNARVRILDPNVGTTLIPGTLPDVLAHPRGRSENGELGLGLYWLALTGGQVTDLCQQYTP